MDPYSLRRRLGDRQFDPLRRDEYLEKLRVVADRSAPPELRRQAKEDLLKAHFRLIAKYIHDFTVGVEGSSDQFDSMARRIYGDLSAMAEHAWATGTELSTMIVRRVLCRERDKIRHEGAGRKAFAHVAELLKELGPPTEPSRVEERLRLEEAYAELRDTIDQLPETEWLVCQALVYGFETEQDLTIAQVARKLQIPETTARSAFHSAWKKVQRRFLECKAA